MIVKKDTIFIKGEDKSDQIEMINFIHARNLYIVKYKSSTQKYFYGMHDVSFFKEYTHIKASDYYIYFNGQKFENFKEAKIYGKYIVKVTFNDNSQINLDYNMIKFSKKVNNNNGNRIFNYLKEISMYTGLVNEEGMSMLTNQYNRMGFISKDSVLFLYLNELKVSKFKDVDNIYPFGTNSSQKSAVENASDSRVSIIEGPPGTGKTQTILNIIANAVLQNKTVAVVSNNNSATENVLEKLKKYDLDFMVAFLGNKDNKESFISTQNEKYPNFSKWKLPHELYEKKKHFLEETKTKIDDAHTLINRRAIVNSLLDEIKVEEAHFKLIDHSNFKIKTFLNLNFNDIKASIFYLEKLYKLNFFNILYLFLKYGFYNIDIIKPDKSVILDSIRKYFYIQYKLNLEEELNILEEQFKIFNVKKEIQAYSETSMEILKHSIARKYLNMRKEKRPVFSSEDFYKNTDKFLKEYPIILSTTHSIRTSTNPRHMYDLLIIDEASQVDLVTGALAISCAKKAVIVGDEKQLPNIITNEVKNKTNEIFNKYNISEKYSFSTNSFLSSCLKVFPDAPKVLLKEHYRCHPKIIGFCNKNFYDDQLIILNEQTSEKAIFLYKTVEGNHSRGKYNQRQIDVIINEVMNSDQIDFKKDTIGIITPYVNQKQKLRAIIKDESIEIDTVHKFQGREKDVIIISTVDDDNNEFSENSNLLNVAISRAIKKLFIVTPNQYSKSNSNIANLIKYIEYNNMSIVHSNINSIFDHLYRKTELEEEIVNGETYKSEVLMEQLLTKVLKNLKIDNISYVRSYPLKLLIKPNPIFNNDENKFIYKTDSHNDFVLFNKVTKQSILAIEVDGYRFHEENEKQKNRDEIKDLIFKKIGLPLIRFKTNESNEEARLIESIKKVV